MNLGLFFPAARLMGFSATPSSRPRPPHARADARLSARESQPVRVLVVDDDADIRNVVRLRLQTENGGCHWQVSEADSLHTALERLAEHGTDVILLDLCLGDSQGIETLERVRRVAHDTAIIVMTGLESDACGAVAMMEGAQEFLQKPLESTLDELPSILCRAMESQAYIEQLRAKQIVEAGDGTPPRIQGACDAG